MVSGGRSGNESHGLWPLTIRHHIHAAIGVRRYPSLLNLCCRCRSRVSRTFPVDIVPALPVAVPPSNHREWPLATDSRALSVIVGGMPYGESMVCLVCSLPTRDLLCGRCRSTMQPHPDRLIGGSLLVQVGLAHRGAARVLVRRLKYEAVLAAAVPLAEAMAARVDD